MLLKKISKIFFEISFCIILVWIGYYIGKKIHEQRKKRANELRDDNYEYYSENNNYKNFNKNDSLIQNNYNKKETSTNDNNKLLELAIKF